MKRKSVFSALAGTALMSLASIAMPSSASAFTVRTGGGICYLSVNRSNTNGVTASEVSCDRVQARIQRYYGSKIYTYYGPTAANVSRASSTNGYYTGGGGRIEKGGYSSGWAVI